MARYATLETIDDARFDQVRVGEKVFAPGKRVEVTEEEVEQLKALNGYKFSFRSGKSTDEAKDAEQDQ